MAKNIITYGTFDTFHYGHLELLIGARRLGSYLTVGLSTDEFNLQKEKSCVFNYRQRKNWLENINVIDRIIAEKSWAQKKTDIVKYNIDILVMGSDWTGKFDDLDCDVVYLPRTKIISSSEIKKILGKI